MTEREDLLAALKEAREVVAAFMRALNDARPEHGLATNVILCGWELELGLIGVKLGFGKRWQDLIALCERPNASLEGRGAFCRVPLEAVVCNGVSNRA